MASKKDNPNSFSYIAIAIIALAAIFLFSSQTKNTASQNIEDFTGESHLPIPIPPRPPQDCSLISSANSCTILGHLIKFSFRTTSCDREKYDSAADVNTDGVVNDIDLSIFDINGQPGNDSWCFERLHKRELAACTITLPPSLLYDYNNNGKIDSGDYQFLLGVRYGGVSCPKGKVCDIYKDGRVDEVDLNALKYFIDFDYNNDANLDSKDTDILRKVIFFGEKCQPEKVCDVSRNGIVNAIDATYLWHLMSFDYNYDGKLNEADINYLTGVVYSSVSCQVGPIQKLCDANQDGKINQSDIDYLKGQIEKLKNK